MFNICNKMAELALTKSCDYPCVSEVPVKGTGKSIIS